MTKNMRKWPARAAAAMLFTLAAGACGSGGSPAVHEISADYPFFSSAAELAQSADVVVTATAKKEVSVRRLLPDGVDTSALPAYKRAELGVIVTDVAFTVRKTHKGADSSEVVVTELGGKIGNSRYVAEDMPNARPGQEMLLFLHREADGKYTVVGGSQGRYLNAKGVAKKLGNSSVPAPLEGKSAERPELSDTTPVAIPSSGGGQPVTGNGGKPATPAPPTGG